MAGDGSGCVCANPMVEIVAVHCYNRRDVNIARNRAIKTLALPSGKTHLVFADNDIVPSRQTDPFFQADADVVGAMFDLPDMASWSDPEMFHFGLVRFQRHMLAAIQPPWFQRIYSPNGAGLVKCGCLYLRDKIKEIPILSVLRWPLSYVLIGDSYSPSHVIADISPVPILLIHGTADRTIPASHSQELFHVAQQPKMLWLIEKGRHTEAFTTYAAEYRQKLVKFFVQSIEAKP